MENNQFVVMKDWIDNILKCKPETQEKICWGIINYGIYGTIKEWGDDEEAVENALNFIYPQIDKMQAAYQKKVENGKKGGRKSAVSDDFIYELRCQGKLIDDIVAATGLTRSAIYKREGWKREIPKSAADF